ncbi:Protoporphyrinogen oxidase [Pleomassaria siparia CBS 279.74]|uniref:Protoporphyrinogen oxidase n=1 Tax=Pleomassaria siparia CBS 279.74 TaxID=1314801 RepID=A0A6G1KER3_9PLEO|nr:Protoporphyrinogen oxidase [Pleomassaria siparia CBS 279.74]
MRFKRHATLLESTLRRVSARPRQLLASQSNRFRFASSNAAYPKDIAIIGGGISGLSSAHFVAKEFPNSKITIFDSQEESGGWLRSRRVEVPGGDVIFEYGPRTLRPGPYTLPTIHDLGLEDHVLFTPRDSHAAKNRYIYYPDRLNRMPGSELEFFNTIRLMQSGVMDGVHNILAEPWQRRRPLSKSDESIGDFIARRVDKRIAQNIFSGVFHGIYAGDIWQLSARTLLSQGWHLEGQHGSVLGGYLTLMSNNNSPVMVFPAHPYDVAQMQMLQREINGKSEFDFDFIQGLIACSTYTFKDGLQQLSQTLQHSLENNEQVDIRMGTPVHSYTLDEGTEQVQVVIGEAESRNTQNFDLVISTLRAKELTPYVTVMTVNLFFSKPNLIPVSGFGYLIPQSVPFEQNPERALGVIFDSDAVPGQDTVKGTKLTVMLGGHWWDGWQGYPDEYEGAELAKSVIQRHLGITEEPAACHVSLHHDCIPQYTVGYEDRLKQYGEKLQSDFKGKVRVVGNQYNGVGVNDCVRGAWSLAKALSGDGWKKTSCGLDRAMDTRPWVLAPLPKMEFRKGTLTPPPPGSGPPGPTNMG